MLLHVAVASSVCPICFISAFWKMNKYANGSDFLRNVILGFGVADVVLETCTEKKNARGQKH